MIFVSSIRRAVQLRGAKPATVFGERVRTWREHQDRVARLAEALRAWMSPGATLGILAGNSDHYLEAIHAAWWMGGTIAPMNARWALPEHLYSVEDAAIEVLFVDEDYVDMARQIAAAEKKIKALVFMSEGDAPEGFESIDALIAAHDPAPATPRTDEDPCGVFYTGGTTGLPKGVVHSPSTLWATVTSYYFDVRAPDAMVYLLAPPMFHLGGLIGAYATTAFAGTHVIIPSFKPEWVIEAAARHKIQFTVLVPTMIAMLIDHPEFRAEDFKTLQIVHYGGGAITDRVRQRADELLPHVQFLQSFGQTETAATCTTMTGAIMRALHPDDPKMRSAGRACYGVEVKAVKETGEACAPGEIGELCLKTRGAMLGYLNKPVETAIALRSGWIHTGDAGYLDEDGFVYVCDRIKDIIRSGGENVFSAEVENAAASHPAIRMVAAVATPDEKWGERVHAVVVLQDGAGLTLEDLQAHCRERIAGYKIPRSLEIRDALPLSPQGKILKTELRKVYWEGRERKVG